MSGDTLDIVLFVVAIVVILAIGIWSNRRAARLCAEHAEAMREIARGKRRRP